MTKKQTEVKKIDGKDITDFRSFYEHYEVGVGDETYRISPDVIVACLSEFRFKATKAKVHWHLEIEEYPPLEGVDY